MKQNCWDFKDCGREPGGAKVAEMGVCPAATMTAVDGVHAGTNGGRACWAIVGTFCGGVVQDNIVSKLHHCVSCEFRNAVEEEESATLLHPQEIVSLVARGN